MNYRKSYLPNPVEDYIDGWDEYFPDTVNGEEVSKNIKIFALEGSRPFYPGSHVL